MHGCCVPAPRLHCMRSANIAHPSSGDLPVFEGPRSARSRQLTQPLPRSRSPPVPRCHLQHTSTPLPSRPPRSASFLVPSQPLLPHLLSSPPIPNALPELRRFPPFLSAKVLSPAYPCPPFLPPSPLFVPSAHSTSLRSTISTMRCTRDRHMDHQKEKRRRGRTSSSRNVYLLMARVVSLILCKLLLYTFLIRTPLADTERQTDRTASKQKHRERGEDQERASGEKK